MRGNFVWALIGASGAGKTVTALALAKEWKRSRRGIGGKVFTFDPHDAFEDVADYKISAKDEDWAKLMMKKKGGRYVAQNSLLILDDYRSILKGNNMDANFYDLLALRRKMNLDIIYMTHNPKLILQGLVYWNTMFAIFKTESLSDDFEEKIPKYRVCQQASRIINAYCRTMTEQEYGSLYPNFPYILIKNDSDIIHPINMDENKIKSLKLN